MIFIIFIGSDHGGFELKSYIKDFLELKKISFSDEGVYEPKAADYPDIARYVCHKVIAHPGSLGILVCGTGIGVSVAANKIKGIRAALCGDIYSAKMAAVHNDANVICLGERVVSRHMAREILEAFLSSEFEGGRHLNRISKIHKLEV